MNEQTILLAAQKMMNAAQLIAEVEAMKAENESRERQGLAPAYGENDFRHAARQWQY